MTSSLIERNPETPITMVQAINEALFQALESNPNVIVFGEDVGISGGVFRATEGLQAQFGEARVIDMPLTEAGIIGSAYGMAVAGMTPVAEIQFADYIFPAFDQIVSEVAKLRYRSGGDCACPMVIRTPYGGGIRGGTYHSQSPEAYFTQTPGIKVVIPSTPADAKGLLLSALQSPDPVLFMEPKRLYRSPKGLVPVDPTPIPLGPARLVQAGKDLSVFCYGAMVDICQAAATKLQESDGVSIEIIDLRTLSPIDEASILASVRKTGRALMVYEAPKTGGYGSEISAIIAEKAVEYLKAPIKRVAGLDTPYPYSLESVYMPHPVRVMRAMQEVLGF
ncbi:MAG: alpha-ketoacid dehydrogenase subunit beta [Vampirovibrionales bacterium]|nr:alpha-ketoacid dehydrogenase subunit beta [Vampirovibrionales bacterium]